ncbi:MAG: hypothetical protein N0C84_00350 [Candidatus Thiodiazotropha taylori]|uniref:Uncharacterized protein n=1 Tax=Candidatus Thiodiazotropha taylori TaxID=2792791 RepID=A0A9E4K932_9GAMM|nr:hypothetical protein [Candidatus Thiodiazotropha taylori]MCW4254894.1 hypothetical protein [Candidatus Thiodiazotropha taylori]
MHFYQTDIAHDCDLGSLAEFMQEYNAKLRIIEAIGPGGGNPFVEFIFETEKDKNRFIEFYEN